MKCVLFRTKIGLIVTKSTILLKLVYKTIFKIGLFLQKEPYNLFMKRTKNGVIALWPNTRVVKCKCYVSQKLDGFKNTSRWYNISLTFKFEFTACMWTSGISNAILKTHFMHSCIHVFHRLPLVALIQWMMNRVSPIEALNKGLTWQVIFVYETIFKNRSLFAKRALQYHITWQVSLDRWYSCRALFAKRDLFLKIVS